MRPRSASPSIARTSVGGDRAARLRAERSRDRLIEDRQRIAHRAFRRARNERQRIIVGRRALVGDDVLEVLRKPRNVDAPEVEALAARQHRHRNLADFGGRENELHMPRRLFERLEERVERALREHVHFVDDEHLGARRKRPVARALDDLADVVDAGVGGGVHLDHVGMAAFHDLAAVEAEHRHVDRRLVDRVGFVVERARQDAGRRRFADAAHAGQHETVRDAPRRERVAQRLHHRFLADQVVEGLRAVLSRQHNIRLGRHISAATPVVTSLFEDFLAIHPPKRSTDRPAGPGSKATRRERRPVEPAARA